MATIWSILALVCGLFLLALIGRAIISWVQMFARNWRPQGFVAVMAEIIYTITDPPLKAISRVIPPIRLGGMQLDVGFTVLIFIVVILQNILNALAFKAT